MPVSLEEIRYQVGDPHRWTPHIEEPFSPEALSDGQKPYLVVGQFAFPDSMCPTDQPDQPWDVTEELKGPY